MQMNSEDPDKTVQICDSDQGFYQSKSDLSLLVSYMCKIRYFFLTDGPYTNDQMHPFAQAGLAFCWSGICVKHSTFS